MEDKHYSYSTDEEHYEGQYDSPEDAAADAFDEYPEREEVWVGEIVPPLPPESFLCVADLMDTIQESEEYENEYGDNWHSATPDQLEELEKSLRHTFTTWLLKYKQRPTFFTIRRAKCFKNPNPTQEEE